MKRIFNFLLLALISVSLYQCSSRYVLNEKVIEEHKLSKPFLEKVQLYNTQDIVLTRYEGRSQETAAVKGTVNVNTGQVVEQVVIKAQTPGKIVGFLEDGRIAVSFEPDDSKFIVFGTNTNTTTFHLQAKSWKDDRAIIDYAGKTFYTNKGVSNCRLEFKLKKKYQQEKNTTIARGNKV